MYLLFFSSYYPNIFNYLYDTVWYVLYIIIYRLVSVKTFDTNWYIFMYIKEKVLKMINKFSERLKELRTDKNLSQRTLANDTGFSQPAIARWESGLQIPNIDVAIVMAQYFGVTTDYLLGLED